MVKRSRNKVKNRWPEPQVREPQLAEYLRARGLVKRVRDPSFVLVLIFTACVALDKPCLLLCVFLCKMKGSDRMMCVGDHTRPLNCGLIWLVDAGGSASLGLRSFSHLWGQCGNDFLLVFQMDGLVSICVWGGGWCWEGQPGPHAVIIWSSQLFSCTSCLHWHPGLASVLDWSLLLSFSHVWFFAIPWTATHQASLFSTNS